MRRLTVTVAAMASSGATTLVFNIAAARSLTPIAFGNVAREFSVAMLVAQLTMAGVSPALARHVGQGEDDEERWSRAVGAFRVLWLCAIACSFAYPILAIGGLTPFSLSSIAVGCSFTIIYPVYFGLKSFLFVLDQVEAYAKLEFGTDLLFYVLLPASLIVAPGLVVAVFAIAYGCFIIMASRLVARRAGGRIPVQVSRPLLRYTGLAMLSTYASVARFPAVIAVAGIVTGSVASGQVSALLALLTPLLLIPQAASVLTFASYARARAPQEARDLGVTLRLTFAASMAPIIIGVGAAHFLISSIYGAQFGPLAGAFGVLLLGLGPMIAGMPIGNALAGAGEVRTTAAVSVPGFLLTVTMAYIGGELSGASGVLVGCGLGIGVSGIALAAVALSRLDLQREDFAGGLLLCGVGVIALIQPYIAVACGLALIVGSIHRRARTRAVRMS